MLGAMVPKTMWVQTSGNDCNIKIKMYRVMILLAVLSACEVWSFTSKERHRLSVFENSVLRKIFGPERDEVTEG
jgi:hypothetical protein